MQALHNAPANFGNYAPQIRTVNGVRMAVAKCPQKEFAAQQIVMLKNRGDRPVNWEFDGQLWRLRAKSQMQVLAMMAWHILGDPDLRPGMRNPPTYGTQQTWAMQISDLENMWGAKHAIPMTLPNGGRDHQYVTDPDGMWKYIQNGNFYCANKEQHFGRGEEYYTASPLNSMRPVIEGGDPLSDDTMDARVARGVAQGRSLTVGADPLTDDDD